MQDDVFIAALAVGRTTGPLTERSAVELVAAIRAREITAREVVEAHIEVLERANPRINAVVVERLDAAREEADAADARVAAAMGAEELPPLLGVPCTIKESWGIAGLPQCAGVVARREHMPERSATVVERLRAAGAIPLGLTNTSELTLWVETENRVYGRTHNPYDRRRTAGGSSGGEGAAVGAGMAPIGVGTDFGGSIRLPAFFNGVFGHKSSANLVPMTGHYPAPVGASAPFVAGGPLARRAEDLMPALRAIAGPDGEDELTEAIELGDPGAVALDGMRVLVSESGTIGKSSLELAKAREQAAGALAAAGARLERVETKDMRRALEMYVGTVAQTGVTLTEMLEEAGAEVPPLRRAIRRGGPHTVATRITLALEPIATRVPQRRLKRVDAARESFVRELRDTIGDGVLLHPPAPKVAPKHGGTVGRLWWIHPMLVFNLAGVPATQVPLGLNESGLPLGVQVVANHGRDHVSIAVALELERVFGGWTPPPA